MASTSKKETAEGKTTSSEDFYRHFQNEIISLQEQMDHLVTNAIGGTDRKDVSDQCLASITRLAGEVADASAEIPTYDQRTYNESIKSLQERHSQIQATFAPKQKFSFKSRKNTSAMPLNTIDHLAVETPQNLSRPYSPLSESSGSSMSATPAHLRTPDNERTGAQPVPSNPLPARLDIPSSGLAIYSARPDDFDASLPEISTKETTLSLSAQANTHVVLPVSPQQHNKLPCLLSNIKQSYIELRSLSSPNAPFASLTINDVSGSLLVCNSIDGPAHITGVKNSTLLLRCRQFRMHECENVDVYIYCTSRPIIEDCTNIRFAQLPNFYLDVIRPPSQPQLSKNLYDQVDDFKWLKAQQSPNWSLLPEEKQVSDAVWHEVFLSTSDSSVDETLKAANVPT